MKVRLIIIAGIFSMLLIPTIHFLWIEYGMVCNNAVTEHLQEYSNLFDENTTHETYGINEIGLPFGVHLGNLQECIDHTLKQRAATEHLR